LLIILKLKKLQAHPSIEIMRVTSPSTGVIAVMPTEWQKDLRSGSIGFQHECCEKHIKHFYNRKELWNWLYK